MLANLNAEKVMDCDLDLPETQATIEEDTAIELQYHAADRAAGENYNGVHSLLTMPGLTTPKIEGDAKRLKTKTGKKKLPNLVIIKIMKHVKRTQNETYKNQQQRKCFKNNKKQRERTSPEENE